MFIILVIGIGLGALICAWHRERLLEVEERVRAEMQEKINEERKLHVRDEIRLYDEIMELNAQLAAAKRTEETARKNAFLQGRKDAQREMTDSASFGKSYETQRIHYALMRRQ